MRLTNYSGARHADSFHHRDDPLYNWKNSIVSSDSPLLVEAVEGSEVRTSKKTTDVSSCTKSSVVSTQRDCSNIEEASQVESTEDAVSIEQPKVDAPPISPKETLVPENPSSLSDITEVPESPSGPSYSSLASVHLKLNLLIKQSIENKKVGNQ